MTQIFSATPSAFAPENKNGASANAATTTISRVRNAKPSRRIAGKQLHRPLTG